MMVDAIRSGRCASVGIGQPSASDSRLPLQILAGQVGDATEPDSESTNEALLPVAAGYTDGGTCAGRRGVRLVRS
jgi:hypothetical protein